MKVLLIKLTSMGDIIHTFPAVTDALQNVPNAEFDWLVDESFQLLPAWHPAIRRVITVPFRKMRKSMRVESLLQILKHLRLEKYDLIIDAQGLIKTGILSAFLRGPRIGFDWSSARERLSSLFYSKHAKVSWNLHAVTRARQLFAQAFQYACPTTTPNYGLKITIENPRKEPYLIFFHGTTWVHKHWPEAYWQQLISLAKSAKLQILLPWGNSDEKARAERLAQGISYVEVLPKLDLAQIANLIAGAQGIVSVDSGLGHLSASFAKPTVSLYGPTDPNKTGALGYNQLHLQSHFSCAPCLKRVCHYSEKLAVFPACFAEITPERVWEKLCTLREFSSDVSE